MGVLLGDLGVREDAGVVGRLVRLRLGDGHVAVGLGLGDGGIFLDKGSVVRAEILDEPVLVGDVLDVAGQNFNAQLIHVPAGLHHHLVGEGVAVRVDLLERKRADDLAHVALEGILEVFGDVDGLFIQKVLRRELDALRRRGDADLCHRVHVDIDKVVGGDGLLRLDVDGHLAEIELVEPLEEGDLDAGAADQYPALLLDAGDDVGLVGRGFHIAQEQQEHNDHHDDDDGHEWHDITSFFL